MNHTLELNDEELRLLRAALHAYLDDFGHEEADVLRRLKELLAKLPTPGVPDDRDDACVVSSAARVSRAVVCNDRSTLRY